MALGQQLIGNILSDDLTKSGVKHVKGAFTGERNHAIICRLYFHYRIKGLRYDVAIEVLHKEFFLSELRLAQIIMDGRDDLEKLKSDKAEKKDLVNKFPHFNWN